jgi:hypothetical protein
LWVFLFCDIFCVTESTTDLCKKLTAEAERFSKIEAELRSQGVDKGGDDGVKDAPASAAAAAAAANTPQARSAAFKAVAAQYASVKDGTKQVELDKLCAAMLPQLEADTVQQSQAACEIARKALDELEAKLASAVTEEATTVPTLKTQLDEAKNRLKALMSKETTTAELVNKARAAIAQKEKTLEITQRALANKVVELRARVVELRKRPVVELSRLVAVQVTVRALRELFKLRSEPAVVAAMAAADGAAQRDDIGDAARQLGELLASLCSLCIVGHRGSGKVSQVET